MCQECGCATSGGDIHINAANGRTHTRSPGAHSVDVLHNILAENDHLAAHNREHFSRHRVLAVNLMSSPGSGKTALLEATIAALKNKYRIAVIEGDLETENDAARIRAHGVPAVQITTGQTCHLDAQMVHDALHALMLDNIDILFIENVGNLVCPAGFDLGQHANVTLLAVTEGDDKPAKYPVMFRVADLVLFTKIDLLAVLDDFAPDKAQSHIRKLANVAPVMPISARRADTLKPWFDWLGEQLLTRRALARAAEQGP
jgi:hydrogenase nickel incorporation protein HypB